MHAVGKDDFVGKGQPPWLHGVVVAEMLLFDFRIAMVGDSIALRSFDPVLYYCYLDLFVEGEGRGRAGLGVVVVLNYACPCHFSRAGEFEMNKHKMSRKLFQRLEASFASRAHHDGLLWQ